MGAIVGVGVVMGVVVGGNIACRRMNIGVGMLVMHHCCHWYTIGMAVDIDTTTTTITTTATTSTATTTTATTTTATGKCACEGTSKYTSDSSRERVYVGVS